MKIAIGCTQRFDVTVTRSLVDVLTKLGTWHYDNVCRSAVMCGGLIYGWVNQMDWLEVGEETFVASITNRELQTCLKICETSPTMSAAEIVTRGKFTMLGYAALRQASEDQRFALSEPVVPGAKPARDTRDVEIEKLRAENSRLYSQAVALLYFVPDKTKVGDIQEVRAKYDEWLKVANGGAP